jgi:hypothetical protein
LKTRSEGILSGLTQGQNQVGSSETVFSYAEKSVPGSPDIAHRCVDLRKTNHSVVPEGFRFKKSRSQEFKKSGTQGGFFVRLRECFRISNVRPVALDLDCLDLLSFLGYCANRIGQFVFASC